MTDRPQVGVDGFRAELQSLRDRLTRLEQAQRTASVGTRNQASRAWVPRSYGTATGTVPAHTAEPPDAITFEPVTWTSVSSDYEIDWEGHRIQLPVDGLWLCKWKGDPGRGRGVAHYGGTVLSVEEAACNLVGAAFGSYDFNSDPSGGGLVLGTVFGHGSNIALRAAAVYQRLHPDDAVPATSPVTIEFHLLWEG